MRHWFEYNMHANILVVQLFVQILFKLMKTFVDQTSLGSLINKIARS